MDQSKFKVLAKRLHNYLVPHLGVAFKLGHAQELLTAIAGVRDVHELRSHPKKLEDAIIDLQSVERICKRVKNSYDTEVDAELLLAELSGQFVTHRTKAMSGELPRAWICDVCHKLIDNLDRGYVIWKSQTGGRDHDFKIIHQSDCDLPDHDSSMALRDCLGQDGLNMLLMFLSPGAVLKQFEKKPRLSVPNLDEWVDLVRRVQIPYYDLARPLFKHPQFIADFCQSGEWTTYRPKTLKEALSNPIYRDD